MKLIFLHFFSMDIITLGHIVRLTMLAECEKKRKLNLTAPLNQFLQTLFLRILLIMKINYEVRSNLDNLLRRNKLRSQDQIL